jgi:hypothetical protein
MPIFIYLGFKFHYMFSGKYIIMSRSKSLMTGAQNTSKSLVNPVSTSSQQELQFGPDLTRALNIIENQYVSKMAAKKYLEIPDLMTQYLSLNDTMVSSITKQRNTNLRLLFQIANDGLLGSLNSKTLNADNVDLNFQKLMLNRKVDDILSGKNEVNAMGDVTGEISITKTFKLAPLYSYYIYLYGMPDYGVGFDAAKLSLLVAIMNKYGINPYR